MKRHLALISMILFTGLLLVRGEGPDDRYVQIYNLIQEADGLNDNGQGREAAFKFHQAQKDLKALQADYPDWNANVVKFRLGYIASKLEPLAEKFPAPNATNAPPSLVTTEPPPVLSGTNLLKELQEEIKRLTLQNGHLEARLKEALSVQPAPLDPRELAKAEEQIKQLLKEKDLLKVSLDQEREKAKAAQPADSAALEQERKILAEVKEKLAQQTDLAASLQKENEGLKKQLADAKPTLESPSTGDLGQQLKAARATAAALQSSNLDLRAEQILLEARVSDLSRQLPKRGTGTRSSSRPKEPNGQLEFALARLAVYEAKPVPLTPEEAALFRQSDLQASFTEANPVKRSVKTLPPGAGPLMEAALRAQDNGGFDDAEKKLLEILRQDERNSYILGTLASVQIEQGRLADAEKSITKALEVDPRDPASLFTMGLVRYHQEKYDAAFDALSLSAALIPDDYRTQYYLGKTLIKKGNRTAAETALRKAVQLRPEWGVAHFDLAMVYATQQPPFKELAQWHYGRATHFGFPRNLDFEKLLEEKKP